MHEDRKQDGRATPPASPKTSVKLASFLILLSSPFILLWLIDRSFSFAHWHINPDYFPSEREVLVRQNVMPARFSDDEKAFIDEIKSSKIKVAIFGGSSAAGFAAPVGLARFLEEAAPDRLVIHNYAEGGAPFVGFQEELAKIVMPYYDVIILYAGHNEVWSYLYKGSRELNEGISFPWGSNVEYGAVDFRHSLKMMQLKRLFNDDVLNGDLSFFNRVRTTFWGSIYNISLNSRLAYFIKSLGTKVIGSANLLASGSEKTGEKRLPFFEKTPFIGDEAKQRFVDGYMNSVSEIKNKLHPGQKLIISTVLSNDLFPPLLDAVDEKASLPDAESRAASLYAAVGTPGLKPADASTLPGSAHKAYLNAAFCLGGISPTSLEHRIEGKCIDFARNARSADTFPTRVLPSINDFIRSSMTKEQNVYVIDPERRLNEQRTEADYLDFFVDFQHPSSFGHMNIANEIVPLLLPHQEITFAQKDACDTFAVRDSQGERQIAPRKGMLESQVQTNLKWLDLFSKRASNAFMYEFYKNRAQDKLRRCAAAG
jgi:hypothetical protein